MYSKIFQTARLFYHGGLEKHRLLKELDKSQWLSQDIMAARKLGQIQNMLNYAYKNVPYYRDLFLRMDIHPNDVKSYEDFQKLPFLTREMVMEHKSELVSTIFDKKKLILRETSGSTGFPMQFYIDESFWWWATALENRGHSWYGIQEGDKVAWVWGLGGNLQENTFSSYIRSRIFRHRFLDALNLTPSHMQSFAEMLVKWQPDMFMAYGTAMTIFGQYVHKHHIKGIHPRLIETTGEVLNQTQRNFLENVFECPLADNYSSREMGPIAFDCPHGSMHINENCYVELIADNKPVSPGEKGEVVLTHLHNFAMPFIRYKITDLATESTKICSCGRGLPVMQGIDGRANDLVVTSEGGFVTDAFFEFLLQDIPQIARFQIYQPNLENLQVTLELREQLDRSSLDSLHKKLMEPFNSQIKIEICIVDEIKHAASGKFRVVISDVQNNLLNNSNTTDF